MGLLYPGALWLLAIVPVLVLPYFARERPSRVTVSSVIAFRAIHAMRREHFGRWPRLDWTFFLEAAALILAALAIGVPYLSRASNPIAVVLDNSAAMQATLPEGVTRFAKAQKETDAMLANQDANSSVVLYLTSPRPHQVGEHSTTLDEARAAIASAKPTDAPNNVATLLNLLTDLSSGTRFTKVIFASECPLASGAPSRVTAITVGDPVENYAIGSFTLSRESFGAEALHARITVANFSTKPRDLTITISGDDHRLGTAKTSLGPGETGLVEFPSLSPAKIFRAELGEHDAFALDNVAYATAGSIKKTSILFVSPQPADADGLASIPDVAVTTRTPDAFMPTDLQGIDLAIFQYAIPHDLPPVNTLLVMPPPGDPLFGFTVAQVSPVQIARWSAADPLTDSVNFRLLEIRAGEVFATHPWMASVVDGNGGSLMMRGERQGHRFLALGFNPFPYLGRRNLPMSILTLNSLGYLAGVGENSAGYRTGQPWLVPAGIKTVVTPAGVRIAVTPGTLFRDVGAQGVYELIDSRGASTPRAINLGDLTVSDLEDIAPLRVEAASGPRAQSAFLDKIPLNAWLLAVVLALLIAEAMFVYRRRTAALEA
ncbi:MAG TPA: BatA and WFA domain-containing protein [Candidatus Binataceae bacterium]|nr:BatA and WFA domain-containing protein [Candidatus Binataceae bacterium]